jgi:DtxR family transcriptional regulator, Mn-dependent transcriptional regulator
MDLGRYLSRLNSIEHGLHRVEGVLATETWKRFNEKELTHSMAHYLQAVAGLKREKGHARVGDIAERLGVSKSGVTSMLRSLQSRGLVDHEPYGCVELTAAGLRLAQRTEANRTILVRFFADILRVPEGIAVEDACMIEHLVSPETMVQFLRLTSYIQSDEATASRFRNAFRAYQAGCEGGAAGEDCPVCQGQCLRESLDEPGAAPDEAKGLEP